MSYIVDSLKEKYNRTMVFTEELAEELAVDVNVINEMVKNGNIKTNNILGNIRISLEEIERVFGVSDGQQNSNKIMILESVIYNGKKIDAYTCYEEYVDYWLCMQSVKDSTKKGYRNTARAIAKKIGKYPIGAITHEMLIPVMEAFQSTNEFSTLQKTYRIMKMSFSFAEEKKLIKENPMRLMKLKANVEEKEEDIMQSEYLAGLEGKALTVAEVTTILDECKDDMFVYTIVKLILYTGLRPSEIRALMWKNINFEKEVIHVRNAAREIHEGLTMKSNGVHKTVIGIPKSIKSIRDIPMCGEVKRLLKKWKIYKENCREYNKSENGDLIFPSKRGGILGGSGLGRRFKSAMQQAGLHGKGYELYSLRHTFCNVLIKDCGVDIKTVQELMGHYRPEVLLNHYLETNNQYKKNAINQFENLYKL